MAQDLARYLLSLAPIPVDTVDPRDAKARYAAARALQGAAHRCAPLLTWPSENRKFEKTADPVYGLALAQSKTSGEYNACRHSSPDCVAGCVATSGNGRYASVAAGRTRKTLFLASQPRAFLSLLDWELGAVDRRHPLEDPLARLNTFSDLPWETIAPDLFSRHPRIRFYDYTKWPDRGPLPDNYRLTFSASERTTDREIRLKCHQGHTVAVVFRVARTRDLPATYLGCPVVDADKSDNRYDQPRGTIAGLRAKGRMITDPRDMVRSVPLVPKGRTYARVPVLSPALERRLENQHYRG